MKNIINRQREKSHNDEPGNGADEDNYSMQDIFSLELIQEFQ